jgi:hypothetical protein
MIYLRVFLKSGKRVYHKVDLDDRADATKLVRRQTKGFARAEHISRQDYEVGLLEMDIELADAAGTEGSEQPELAGFSGLQDGSGRQSKYDETKPGGFWANVIMGLIAFVCGIAMMTFWSVWDLDTRRSIIILVLSFVLLGLGLIFLVVGLVSRRD